MPLMGTGLAVKFDVLNEKQAQINHGQSLDRLAERGGLSPCEALAVVEKRAWKRGINNADTVACLNEIIMKMGA